MSDKGEQELKDKFQDIVKNDFEIFSDVGGKDLVHDKKYYIDFMLYPKPHLIELGFEKTWFGIEVKHFDSVHVTGKMSRFIWQCISYTQAVFKINGRNESPTFVLGFSNVDKVLDELCEDKDKLLEKELCREYRSQWTGMVRIAGLAHVGFFHEIMPSNYKPLGGWNIVFSSSSYFRLDNGRYKKLNYNIFKENVGNCAK